MRTASVTYRIIQAGEVVSHLSNVQLVTIGEMVGTVGDVPCFTIARFVDIHDKRRARDVTPDTYNGPATIEVVSQAGEVIGWIGLATRADVVQHPRGEVAARR